ncbi:MAG: dethiobiotin synthase [Acidobacteriota bacterium]|nr:dethiobiotin synthase [Acidobacteriota bacterium]
MSAGPGRLVLVVGTGTEIGKTWVSCRLLERWRAAGVAVAARKPAQSFEPGQGPTDAELLAAASGEAPEVVCPPERSYPVPAAPPLAARRLGRTPLRLRDLVEALDWPEPGPAVGLVETAGGLRSPQAEDGDAVDLAVALRPACVVLVANAGLGTIHAVRSAVGPLAGVPPAVVVVLNRYDPADVVHDENRRWLAETDGLDVCVADGPGLDALAAALAGTTVRVP